MCVSPTTAKASGQGAGSPRKPGPVKRSQSQGTRRLQKCFSTASYSSEPTVEAPSPINSPTKCATSLGTPTHLTLSSAFLRAPDQHPASSSSASPSPATSPRVPHHALNNSRQYCSFGTDLHPLHTPLSALFRSVKVSLSLLYYIVGCLGQNDISFSLTRDFTLPSCLSFTFLPLLWFHLAPHENRISHITAIASYIMNFYQTIIYNDTHYRLLSF